MKVQYYLAGNASVMIFSQTHCLVLVTPDLNGRMQPAAGLGGNGEPGPGCSLDNDKRTGFHACSRNICI